MPSATSAPSASVLVPRAPNQPDRQVKPQPTDDLEAIKQRLESAAAAQRWVAAFQRAVDKEDVDAAVNLFAPDGWYRDMLVMDRGDFNSYPTSELKDGFKTHGLPQIKNLTVVRPADSTVMTVNNITWHQSFLVFESNNMRGKGFLRLKDEGNGKLDRAFTFFLTLWEIKGHEEFAFERRPNGAEIHERDPKTGEKMTEENWKELREKKVAFETEDPAVLIVGGGQSGCFLAARLGAVGIPTLIIDKNEKVGDNWRNRYKSLVLHDPSTADHFPYVPYPKTWPKFTPKDKLADFFKSYAEIMELNFWGSSTLQGEATYDEQAQKWEVTIARGGQQPRKMRPNHVVLATGFSGHPRIPNFKNMDKFEGPIMHAAKHKGAEGWQGKKAVVIGCCNTGHDIAEDFWEHGADTTIVQRSSTYVVSSEHGLPAWLNGFYDEGGPPTEDADLMFTSLPTKLLEEFHVEATKDVFEKDSETLRGLERAGFKLNNYPAGLFMKLFIDGGGYYLDVGCSKLIADGKIKVKQGQEIEEILPHGIKFADGTTLDADIIVMATGYTSMRESVRSVIGGKVADALPTLWNLDKQYEIHTAWRNTGIPGFHLMMGNMFQARAYSRLLALQIHMTELGLLDKNRAYPHDKEVKDARF